MFHAEKKAKIMSEYEQEQGSREPREQESGALDLKELNKFSRQIAALGAEATAKLIKMKVIIVGMRGTGVETAKNLALQGMGAITVIDNNVCHIRDTGVNFFINDDDVMSKKSRADAVAPKLQELNPICAVKVASTLTEEIIRQHNALVITEFTPLDTLITLNESCRMFKVSFFYAFTGGVSTSIFVDHGTSHVITDSTGEKPLQKLIFDIKPLDNGECLIRYEHPEGQPPETFDSGTFEISEVIGMDGINGLVITGSHPGKDPVKTLRIPLDGRTMPPYITGGLLVEKKVPVVHPMQSLASKIKEVGETVSTDLLNWGSELKQHLSFVAVSKFYSVKSHLPRPHSVEDANLVVELAKHSLANQEVVLSDFEIDEEYIKKYASIVGVELQPMAAFVGGVLAQEVVKCTGKYVPIPGFLHFSALEALPDEAVPVESTVPRGHRNDELATVYGWPLVEQMSNLKYFMVGCGALGCEFMKNFALNSVCCGPAGKLVVTDADRIELSNLTRQFLFREHNVGQPKSRAAGVMAKVMNPSFNVESLEMFVGAKTEEWFNDDFWLGLDGVCNALDNMEAREYVDTQCVKYEKSLLESGTMGTKGNVDTVCPFKTKTYRDGGVAHEGGGVPMCTLRNFPQVTDHCIEWARDQFELMFVKLFKKCENYLQNAEKFEEDMLGTTSKEDALLEMKLVTEVLRACTNISIGSCAQLAFCVFHYRFRDNILDLQSKYPKDCRMIDKNGVDKGPFWSEKKRYPTPASFDVNDDSHLDFLLSTTCLFAVGLGLIPPKREGDDDWLREYRNKEFIINLASTLKVPGYIAGPVATEDMDAEALQSMKETADNLFRDMFADLRTIAASARLPAVTLADFEKDDDLNFHIAFISSAANLRCDNYSIKRTNFQSTKVIAGKIIAAIATTTAAVCGLVMLELFKLLLNKPTDAYMNRNINLGTNVYTSFTQEPPTRFNTWTKRVDPDLEDLPAEAFDDKGKVKDEYKETVTRVAYPENHSVWDKLVVSGSLTLQQFKEWFEREHNMTLKSWDFLIGTKDKVPKTSPVFPIVKPLDPTLLPSLDLPGKGQAFMAIKGNSAIAPSDKQKYVAFWEKCKASGCIISEESGISITESSTLLDILKMLEVAAKRELALGNIDAIEIPPVEGRKFCLLPSKFTPKCLRVSDGAVVEDMCAIKITFI